MKSEYVNKLNAHVNIDCISADKYIKYVKENKKIPIHFTAVPGVQHSAVILTRRRRGKITVV